MAELDRLAAEKTNPSAPLAAFERLTKNDPKFWDTLAQRFESAARALKDPAQKRLAHDSSNAAKDTAKALLKSQPSPAARK